MLNNSILKALICYIIKVWNQKKLQEQDLKKY